MRKELPAVDSFSDVFREVNEDTTLGSYQGKLFIIVYQHLVQGLFKKFVFNNNYRKVCNNLMHQQGRKLKP
eukprot:UN08698